MSRLSLAWLTAGGAVLLLASPLKQLWARPSAGWIAPFVLWLALIVVAAWLTSSRGSGGSGDDV